MKSRANSTTKTYLRIIRKFFGWCKANGIQLKLPFHSSVVALYLHSESKRACSSSTITVASAALKWLHGFSPETNLNPLNTDFCKHVIEAAKRTVNNSVQKKIPLTSQAIRDIIDKFGRNNNNLKDLRVAAICTLGFAGFFRYDELKNMRPHHIKLCDNHIKILVPKSKTDIYREGKFVYIRKTDTEYCPLAMLLRYMTAARIDFTDTLPLFRSLTFLKNSRTYSLRRTELSYSRCREIFNEALKAIGYDVKDYGLHSLRSGGITSVVHNSDNTVPERLLKLHGRWKTDTAKDMYVQESVHKRLEVTSFLGL